MSTKIDNLAKLLTPFGLDGEEARVYLLLLKKGVLAALEIHRQTKISRTKVYRILDKLSEKGLVHKKTEDLGQKFGATAITQLEVLIAQKEKEVLTLKHTAPMILEQLALLAGGESSSSKILYYSGKEGLKHVLFNALQARERLFLYGFSGVTSLVGEEFQHFFHQEVVKKSIYTYQIISEKKISFATLIPEDLDRHWELRFIHQRELGLEYEMLVYNDTCTVFVPARDKEEAICVEIKNEHIARVQKQFFQFAWLHSQRMRAVDEQRTMVVEE